MEDKDEAQAHKRTEDEEQAHGRTKDEVVSEVRGQAQE